MASTSWYKNTYRWCQTNLTEIDAQVCDISFWKQYWEENKVQGIIVNAGGIVAYYPSDNKLQYRSKFLGDRDMVQIFTEAAKEKGIRVLARMDINRATKEFYEKYPQWFAQDKNGKPYMAGDRYFSCVNSDYYKTYIPTLLQEIIEKYHPDGITDNSWQGASAKQICYCENCRKKFKEDTGLELPAAPDWEDKTYKIWIKWSFQNRLDNWDLFNEVTKHYGGEDCLWLGMVNANPVSSHCALYDIKEIGERSVIIMTDHQSRDPLNGFEQNSLNGALLQAISGWDVVIPESMANYVRGVQTFRRGSNPKKETQKWMVEGIAGGISPWVHYVGGLQEDARQYDNCREVMSWHEENQQYLYNRIPISSVGLVWSQANVNFYGKDDSKNRCAYPWRGFSHAMTRSRIPFIPIHADHITKHSDHMSTLILPDIAVLTDDQIQQVLSFVKKGGSVIYSGAAGMLDEWGEVRASFPLDDCFGIKRKDRTVIQKLLVAATEDWEEYRLHNYMRLPRERHRILEGFEKTDILPFGGQLYEVEGAENLQTIATFVPPFPIYPPEFSYMNPESSATDIPLILAGDTGFGGKVIYLAGDIDRRYGQFNMADHGDLLANAILWAMNGSNPIRVTGKGYVDCRLYSQGNAKLLHIVNLSGCNQYPGLIEEEYSAGPLEVAVKVGDCRISSAVLRVSGQTVPVMIKDGWADFTLQKIDGHELIVLSE